MTNTLRALVFAIRHEARGVVSVELRPASQSDRFPAAEAGAHIDLHLANGLVRSYSICELDPTGQRYVIAVLNDRESRGGSRYVHEKLRVGTQIEITSPRNNFRLLEGAPHIVLIAGGIGITPIYAMLQRLHHLGRSVDVVYCARTREEAAFSAAVERLAGPDQVTWHFDDEEGGPPDIKALLARYDKDTHFYCCGPAPMLDAYEKACADLDFANVHLERFAALVRGPEAWPDGEFEVELRQSERTLAVPVDKSILQVLLDAGVDTDYSCEEGICGSCETRVIEGDVDHRDSILTDQERFASKTMMICVSRCKGKRLVLDK